MSKRNDRGQPPGNAARPQPVTAALTADRAQQPPADPVFLRDQRRALHAYKVVVDVPLNEQPDYKIAVNDLGANILRNGLSSALAALERLKDGRGKQLLGHLAAACVPGLDGATADKLPGRVRELDVDAYMVATREILQLAGWLKRAAQATFQKV